MEKLRDDLKFLRDGLGVRVILETVPDDLNISGGVEQDLYLVLREGLMNIARHSHATVANVTLTQTDNEVRGSLTDDGVGFDLTQSGNQGGGLSSMKERVEKLGGRLSVQSSPGMGAIISFVVPISTGNGAA